MLPCDVEDIASVDAMFAVLREKWGKLDFVVHAIGFADKNELKGRYADTRRENFSRTMVISCFSFTEVAKRAAELMPERRQHDHADLRRLGARDAELQRDGRRQGGAGGLRALSRLRFRTARTSASTPSPQARSVRSPARASAMRVRCSRFQQKHSPLRRGVTLDELGGSALYLLSDLSGGVTGEIHYVDSGYNIISDAAAGRSEASEIVGWAKAQSRAPSRRRSVVGTSALPTCES